MIGVTINDQFGALKTNNDDKRPVVSPRRHEEHEEYPIMNEEFPTPIGNAHFTWIFGTSSESVGGLRTSNGMDRLGADGGMDRLGVLSGTPRHRTS